MEKTILDGDKCEIIVSLGRYLSDLFYMAAEEGLGPKGGKGSDLWEMTSNFIIETKAGEKAEIGGGVSRRWDCLGELRLEPKHIYPLRRIGNVKRKFFPLVRPFST